MKLENFNIDNLLSPCCSKAVQFEDILSKTQWSSNIDQWGIFQWNYYRCPLCNSPCWFGYENDISYLGIYGAAPVADLIPGAEVDGMPKPKLQEGGITIEYKDKEMSIHGDTRYWNNA